MTTSPRKHPDIGRSAMYDGIVCKVMGVTRSHRESFGGIAYHLMPNGYHSLKHIIQYVPFDKLAFDPPETVAVSCGIVGTDYRIAWRQIMALVRNKPEPLGYAAGEHLARFCDVKIEKYRNTGVAVPQRCNTCAFRKGTRPNGCVPTITDALKCVLEKVPFMCHEHRKGDAPPVCAGYMLLTAKKTHKTKVPWKFSDEYTGDTKEAV